MDKTPDQKVALVIATLAAFFIPFMGSSVNIAIPTIGEHFGMDAVSLSWVATSFLLAAAMFLLPFGRLADIHGRKRVFAWGIAIYTLASFLSAVAPSGLTLILFRGLQGLGGAMIFSTGIAILTSVYPQEERGKVLGFSVGAVYLGLSFGPSIGGFLTEQFGWRSVFLVHVPIGLLIVSLIAAKLKGEWADARGESFDWVGSLIYTISLMGVVYGLSLLPQALGGWLALAGGAGLILFVGWELKVDSPLMNIKLFRTSTVFAYSNLAALIHYSATFSVGFLLSLYLQYIPGYGAQNAGIILIAQPIVMAVFSPYAGRLSDRIEPRMVASIGMALTALGLFLLVLLDEPDRRGDGHCQSDPSWNRIRAVFLSQHQCRHELGGQEVFRSGLRHPGDHAVDGANAQHGHRHPDFRRLYRQSADHARAVSDVSEKHPGGLPDFRPALSDRHPGLPGPGETAGCCLRLNIRTRDRQFQA